MTTVVSAICFAEESAVAWSRRILGAGLKPKPGPSGTGECVGSVTGVPALKP